ncbi:PepSY-associated TM helix domain-containing protein [Sphingomonas sp. KR1UV-12]|uniref:PepSY-associated TM helix domain-containing protein n=1 Tax=Sphingomonas aurea TaxID=3063994 RepID=A0ABT9EKR1_9SPHN|nr:PepSY-associated TM helix domain-containing protein [Sphingomonas sp. KR1UV-12]MDP1027427.1 PepSY-associated TM helix domain-containing protein [Sphingomonas sp. KR1UV-12]
MSKLAWRRTWFQVHKWIGLILAILIVPISLSGAALVWHDALDRVVNPARFATSGTTLLGPDAYTAAAEPALKPGERIAQLAMPEHDGPVVVSAAAAPAPGARPQGGPPQRTAIYLDPPTARVLDVASSRAGLVRFLHVLHGSLQVPGVGRTIVGWIGVAMMVSCFTGLWLWWPTVGRWARGLRWRRHRNTDTNLHYLMGFWVALPLFILSLTGAWISFPAFFAGLTGQGGPQRGPDRGGMMRAQPLARPAQSVATVLREAQPLAGGATLRSIAWPTDKSPDWTVTFAGGGAPLSIKVADDTGTATPAAAGAGGPQGGVARLMRRIHDGDGMGIVWQVVIFIGGILPAVLAITGIIMWWRARGWKAELAAKQRAKA